MIGLNVLAAATIILTSPTGEAVESGYEARLSLDITDQVYVFASYNNQGQTLQTQDLGKVNTYGAGLGYQFESGFFVDVGALTQEHNYSQRVGREAVYHTFTPIFGQPPFADNFTQVEFQYHTSPAPAITVGYEWELSGRISAQVSYQAYQPRADFKIWNPDFLIDDAEGGEPWPFWEGSHKVDNSQFRFGISLSF